jgi:hypothetical protein
VLLGGHPDTGSLSAGARTTGRMGEVGGSAVASGALTCDFFHDASINPSLQAVARGMVIRIACCTHWVCASLIQSAFRGMKVRLKDPAVVARKLEKEKQQLEIILRTEAANVLRGVAWILTAKQQGAGVCGRAHCHKVSLACGCCRSAQCCSEDTSFLTWCIGVEALCAADQLYYSHTGIPPSHLYEPSVFVLPNSADGYRQE